jgi:hypothetical protein
MKPPHSQANRSGRTPWSVPVVCAVLLSIPAHAIEVRIDPPEKTIRGLRGLFHRTVKQPRNTVDQARALARSSLTQGPEAARSGRTQQVTRTPDSASSSRRAASRQQDAVTLEEQRSTAQQSKKVERPKSSPSANRDEPAAPLASESETPTQPVSPAVQTQNSSQAAPLPVATVAFARPVPGKKGIVYPPGSDETLDTEIDVSELQPGELARDPRTGNIFRVP